MIEHAPNGGVERVWQRKFLGFRQNRAILERDFTGMTLSCHRIQRIYQRAGLEPPHAEAGPDRKRSAA